VPPKTRYVARSGVNIAYQVVGSGPFDLVFVPGFVSHLDLQWGDPGIAAFLERLASFSRLIIFDKRGTGLSDPVFGIPTLEERMDDVRAVMDAAESEVAAMFGYSEGAQMSLLFAATYPERARELVLFGAYSSPQHHVWERLRACLGSWGEGATLELLAPSLAGGEVQRRMRGLFERAAASPAMASRLIESAADMDVSSVLPMIRTRTLVIHRTNDIIPISAGRYIAEHVPGARFVQLPGDDHMPWVGDADAVLAAIEEFLTGSRHEPQGQRLLATVLFTDVVGSTELVVRLGDERWRDLLDMHDRIVHEELERFGGIWVDSAGDGVFATFDGPVRAIRCARAIAVAVEVLGIVIRAGVHSGELQRSGTNVRGLAVHIGARIAAEAAPGEILVSSTVQGLTVGSGLQYQDRGVHQLKGVPGRWRLLAVAERHQDTHVDAKRQLGPLDRMLTGFTRRMPAVTRGLVRLTRMIGT